MRNLVIPYPLPQGVRDTTLHNPNSNAPEERAGVPGSVYTCDPGLLVRMCDKYMYYIYTCLRLGRFQLSEDELSYIFRGSGDVYARVDPRWIARFKERCRGVYRISRRAGRLT